MIRTQIQLTEGQAGQLRAMAAHLGVSVAEVVRRLVAESEQLALVQPENEKLQRALAVIGRFSSGQADVSGEHDRHLAEAFGG